MRISEFHLEVKDVEKSKDLYKRLIPHKKIIRWANNDVTAFVLENGTAFGLWKEGLKGIHGGQGGTHTHFAFEIAPSEYKEYKNKILDAGLEAKEYTWDTGHKSVYFMDFDGHQGEFITTDWITLNNH